MSKRPFLQTKQVDTTQLIGDPAQSMSEEIQEAYPVLANLDPTDNYDGKSGFSGGGFKDGAPGDAFEQEAQMQTAQTIGDKDRMSAEVERAYEDFEDLT